MKNCPQLSHSNFHVTNNGELGKASDVLKTVNFEEQFNVGEMITIIVSFILAGCFLVLEFVWTLFLLPV